MPHHVRHDPLHIQIIRLTEAAENNQLTYKAENQHVFNEQAASDSSQAVNPALRDLRHALSTMQDAYFSLWLGKWTTAIDWTGAVMGTYISATLSSLSRSMDYEVPVTLDRRGKLNTEAQLAENEINRYFGQSIGYYFGEDAFAISLQAFDDMLWVVLGWLEATQFIEEHSGLHYTADIHVDQGSGREDRWHAHQFIPAFAHRTRVFYNLAQEGWDWRLCGGGMTWNPRLLPYKDAITNELFISASIAMYLHFAGDENCSPFVPQHAKAPITARTQPVDLNSQCDEDVPGRYDPMYRANAENGYQWLKHVGMINEKGLYVDGFHIRGYGNNHSKTTCDERNEMVYTYNQGVILSGLRGLWEATGELSYLEDGHELVRNVIKATGCTRTEIWITPSVTTQQSVRQEESETPVKNHNTFSSDWHGLGSHGILTELCDPSGRCSQDSQTFKGVFFNHMTIFCAPLPTSAVKPGKTHAASRLTAMLHRRSCDEYMPWVVHNAQAALSTRDSSGRFGSWWAAPHASTLSPSADPDFFFEVDTSIRPTVPEGAVDYRLSLDHGPFSGSFADEESSSSSTDSNAASQRTEYDFITASRGDANDRGRGRTLETQGSGLAVVRAQLEFLRWSSESLD